MEDFIILISGIAPRAVCFMLLSLLGWIIISSARKELTKKKSNS
jgi:hypothetical protein